VCLTTLILTILTAPALNNSSIHAKEIQVIQYHDLIKNDSSNSIIIPQPSEIWNSSNQSKQNQQLPTSSGRSSISVIGDLTEGHLASKPSAKFGLDHEHYYTFSPDRHELSTPENNSHAGEFGKGVKIGLVAPTFTAAAYEGYFYQFYSLYAQTPAGKNVTTNLDYLTAKVPGLNTPASAFAMLKLVSDIGWLTPDSNVTVISDADVNRGSIFTETGNGRNINNGDVVNPYGVIILGHQEYVTQNEYDNLRKFVVNGGTMIVLDGNVFYAQVKYDSQENTVTLVKGHGWAFNGKSAWKSVNERWKNETAQWVGSNYFCDLCVRSYSNDPFGYLPHEEQYVTNPHDIILLNYGANPPRLGHVVATYEHNYGKGKVIALGIYSDDIITNGKFQRFLDSLLVRYSPLIRE
jgi:N,N-dimethylformamidase beta subunit-like, C-terminal